MKFNLPAQREPANLRHHFDLGSMWLASSNNGEAGIPLIYAALEFRLQIERLGIYYLQALRGGQFTYRDNNKIIRKYKNVENEIKSLAGNQILVDKRFEFHRKLMRILNITDDFATPNLRTLMQCYKECSDACHITLNVISADAGVRREQFGNLVQVRNCLEPIVTTPTGFATITPGTWLYGLWQRFRAGEDIDAELLATATREGLWATIDPGDGSARKFYGEALHPQADGDLEVKQ
jgi:hypothetical protein